MEFQHLSKVRTQQRENPKRILDFQDKYYRYIISKELETLDFLEEISEPYKNPSFSPRTRLFINNLEIEESNE